MSIPIYNGGILKVGAAIALDSSCCCDPVCESCMTIDEFGYDEDDFLVAIYISNISMVPTYVCNGETATITFSMTNETGDTWVGTDCTPGNESDCAVTFIFFDASGLITDVTASGATVTTALGHITVTWDAQSFSIGETKNYSITFNLVSCTVSAISADVYYGRGYPGFGSFQCVPCNEVPE